MSEYAPPLGAALSRPLRPAQPHSGAACVGAAALPAHEQLLACPPSSRPTICSERAAARGRRSPVPRLGVHPSPSRSRAHAAGGDGSGSHGMLWIPVPRSVVILDGLMGGGGGVAYIAARIGLCCGPRSS